MNTDARRAVFCCVMGADDYMDAFERLLRLPLKAQQEREIVRVVVECCLQVGLSRSVASPVWNVDVTEWLRLQEESFNPYYAALLGKLVAVSKNHKVGGWQAAGGGRGRRGGGQGGKVWDEC